MRKIIQGPSVQWIDIHNPSKEDLQYLKENFAFHPLVLEELIPQVWRTKVEMFPTHLFLVLHYPLYNRERRETRPQELDIIVTKNAVITSHYHSLVPIKSLFDKCNLYPEARNNYMSQGAGFLLFYVLNELWENSLLKINHIDEKLERVEEGIFNGKEAEMLKEISFVKTDIIDFLKIVSPQGDILGSLLKRVTEFFSADLEPYFSHLIGHWNQAKNNLQTYKDTISALEETNDSLLAHKTNQTIRILTTVSLFFLPLTLLTSIFSMNTQWLPFVGSRYDFWMVSGLMLAIVFGMLLFFKKKKWI